MFFKGSFLTAGPAPHPSAPPSDAGDNPPWNSDDERDFAEYFSSGSHKCKHPPNCAACALLDRWKTRPHI